MRLVAARAAAGTSSGHVDFAWQTSSAAITGPCRSARRGRRRPMAVRDWLTCRSMLFNALLLLQHAAATDCAMIPCY
eukprot:1642360-Pleurochrysis_carterae.AAC.2